MKRYFLLLSGLFIILLSACRKEIDTNTQAATEDAEIQAYIKANNLNMTKDTSGIYYQIITTNPGPQPTLLDTVKVSYTGQLLNGTTFDTENGVVFAMNSFVKGVQYGLLKVGTNGKAPYARIKMIIPSRLGYGNTGQSTDNEDNTVNIPRNATLMFTFDLMGFY